MPNLIEIMKKAAVEAVAASNPCSILFGKVISASPLKISVEQRLTLDESHLVLTKNVMDYKTNITVAWLTENITHNHLYTDNGASMTTSDDTHQHQVTGKKEVTIHNALIVGDNVILIQMQGGQKYIVLDKVVIT